VGWPELRSICRLAEDIGFDSVWINDHLLYRTPGGPRVPWEAWSKLAAVAAVTERVEIGPLVACTAFHSPAMIATKAATIDHISGGRLILGLGAGWNEPDYRAFGLPFDHRASRFEESFTIIRSLLREGAINFVGEYVSARDCALMPRSPRPEGPPLMIGSNGPRMLQITLPHVQAWNSWYGAFGNRPQGLAKLLARVDAICAEVDRDPSEIKRTVVLLVAPLGKEARQIEDEPRTDAIPIGGTPEEIAVVLRDFAAAGIDHVQLAITPITAQAVERCGDVLAALDHG